MSKFSLTDIVGVEVAVVIEVIAIKEKRAFGPGTTRKVF